MNPRLIWEVERADLEWLPARLPEIAVALRRRGFSLLDPVEELLEQAQSGDGPRVAIRLVGEAEAPQKSNAQATPPATVVATHRRRRQIENGGHRGVVFVLPFDARPVEIGKLATSGSDADRPMSFGFMAHGVEDRHVEEMMLAFSTAFDLEDNVLLTLFEPSRQAIEAARRRHGERGPDDPWPDISVESIAGLGRCRIDVMVAVDTGGALQPWLGVALKRGMDVIAPNVGGHRERLGNDDYPVLVESVAAAVQDGGDPAIRVSMDSLEQVLLQVARSGRRHKAEVDVGGPLLSTTCADGLALSLATCAREPVAIPLEHEFTAWLTTWNTRCGIASHAKNQLASADVDRHLVLAARTTDLLGVDGANVVRCWDANQSSNGLNQAVAEIVRRNVTSVMIHFNWGFFNRVELKQFVADLVARRIVVFIDMHSTVPPEGVRLADLAEMLRSCDRVFAHGRFDIDRLLRVGVSDNLFVQPLGVIPGPPIASRSVSPHRPAKLATFGYALPNKGLAEFVQAIGVLRKRGVSVRATMLNARHPDPSSADTILEVRQTIQALDLQDVIDFRDEYLSDSEAVRLLSEADLIVNPYQTTGESASAAVRYCMAARRPLLVTPLEIFEDLLNAVFRCPGTSATEIAAGIEDALSDLMQATDRARLVEEAAAAWLRARDISPESSRVNRMASAIRANRDFQGRIDSAVDRARADRTAIAA